MVLKLTEEEIKEIILEWAEERFSGQFNDVDIESTYGHVRSLTLQKKESVKKDGTE